jgi:hypothetical protein
VWFLRVSRTYQDPYPNLTLTRRDGQGRNRKEARAIFSMHRREIHECCADCFRLRPGTERGSHLSAKMGPTKPRYIGSLVATIQRDFWKIVGLRSSALRDADLLAAASIRARVTACRSSAGYGRLCGKFRFSNCCSGLCWRSPKPCSTVGGRPALRHGQAGSSSRHDPLPPRLLWRAAWGSAVYSPRNARARATGRVRLLGEQRARHQPPVSAG